MDTIDTKTCKRCLREKKIWFFETIHHKTGRRKGTSYTRTYCKKCKAQQVSVHRKENPEKVNDRRNAWKKQNPEKVKKSAAIRFQKHSSNLSPFYLRTLLMGDKDIKEAFIHKASIPDELVHLKRKEITIYRKIKQHGNKSNHKENSTESH